MFPFVLLRWWYGRGWASVGKGTGRVVDEIVRSFSIPILLHTLFAPWRQIVTYPGASLEAKLRAYADNMVSRAVGFAVRLIVLIAALVMIVLTVAAAILLALMWPLVPLAAVLLLVKGTIG